MWSMKNVVIQMSLLHVLLTKYGRRTSHHKLQQQDHHTLHIWNEQGDPSVLNYTLKVVPNLCPMLSSFLLSIRIGLPLDRRILIKVVESQISCQVWWCVYLEAWASTASVVPLEVVLLLQGFTEGVELELTKETTPLRSGRFLEGETSKYLVEYDLRLILVLFIFTNRTEPAYS